MNWPELLRIPDAGVDAWFGAVAAQLLNGAELRVAGQSLRPADVELYLHSAGHADPFAHRNPLQLRCGYWYFHRTHGGLRGGTYKGMDLTYGNGTACGGVLIRSLVRPDGTVIDGPSLCVDHLLALTGHRTVAELDRAVAGRLAWDTDNPLSLIRVDNHEPHDILRTPRVGLTLLRAKQLGAMPRYLMRPYRFVGEPRKVAKGKPHMVLALYARGADEATIRRVTGCPLHAIRHYVAEFEAGRLKGDFGPHLGTDAGPRVWCRLYGVWWRVFNA